MRRAKWSNGGCDMAEEVIMPKLEMAQETGKIIEWLKKEGESVEEGEALFIIETDKVTVEIEATRSGILAGIRAEVGEEVPISTVIAYILQPGEEIPEEAEREVEAVSDVGNVKPTVVTPSKPLLVSPVAQRLAKEQDLDLEMVSGTGPKGQITKEDVERVLESVADKPIGGKIRATPSARRLAQEKGISLASIRGSGPKGRIHAGDLLATQRPGRIPMPSSGERVPLEGMRKTIAERVMKSYQATPHISFTIRIDMSCIEAARKRVNKETTAQAIERVSITTFTIMAVSWALMRNPYINSSLIDTEIFLYPDINIGVAVALDNGLIVPVVHNADQKGLLEISNRLIDIVSRAHEGTLTPFDVAGGTFTISNLGPFGIEQFTAIINPPQTAILAVGAIQQEAIPDQFGNLSIKPMARMTLSADHRVIDGALAARFMMDLKDSMEKSWLLQL